MADGIVKVKLGGKEHILRAELKIAPIVEAKTGKGIFALMRAFGTQTATTAEIVAVIEAALSVNGIEKDADEIYSALSVEGLVVANATATAILFELLKPPKPDKKAKNGAAVTAPN